MSPNDKTANELIGNADRVYVAIYKSIAEQRSLSAESRLNVLSAIADFARYHHTGRFFDGRIEQCAMTCESCVPLQSDSEDAGAPRSGPCGKRRVLHVASTIYSLGGVSREIANWIQNDRDSHHFVAISKPSGDPIPDWLQNAVNANCGRLLLAARSAPIAQRAAWLRRVSRTFDFVVLHTCPHDVVPLLAFARAGGVPVALANQADHVFWLGTSVADAILNLRPAGRTLTQTRRFHQRNLLVPLPLNPNALVQREHARALLGLGEEVVLVSVGSTYKYKPSTSRNFFADVSAVLRKCPTAHMFVVGVEKTLVEAWLDEPLHHRLHCIPWIPDPAVYQASADVYVESYPFGSQTAMLEAAMRGVPTVPAYAPESRLLATDDDSLLKVISPSRSAKEHVELISMLL